MSEPVATDWRSGDLAEAGVAMRINGEFRAEGKGAAVLGGPLKALAWLASELSGNGDTLRAGEIVSTGSAIKPPAVAVGDRVEADFGEFGRVSAQIT
jgi:2-keto-4-pentenoate hydratase